jgi:uncharacterized protein (DUF362 family)
MGTHGPPGKTTRRELLAAFGMAALGACGGGSSRPTPSPPSTNPTPPPATYDATVAVTRAYNFGDSQAAIEEGFSLIGGIRDLVHGKVVTIKVNLTGYSAPVKGLPATETYATHGETVRALVAVLVGNGARLVRIVESAPQPITLEAYAAQFGWDTGAIKGTHPVEFENTRNLGRGSEYKPLAVPGGTMFRYFLLNHSYADTDVYVSLSKMKNHMIAGVTLGLKNSFGITPNALYGTDAPNENAEGNRGGMHERREGPTSLPGATGALEAADRYMRVPNIVAEENAARPIHLSIVEAISTMSGGEGPWSEVGPGNHDPNAVGLRVVKPGCLIIGRDPVATDAVAIKAMGYQDPLSESLPPFHFNRTNYLKIASEVYGLGTADLARIEVKGTPISQVATRFAWI